jgi:two-component system chemotaxis response regulator CheB
VLVSTLTQAGADVALRGLELGAVDYCAKPLLDIRQGMMARGQELVGKVKAAAHARLRSARPAAAAPRLRDVVDHRLSSEGRIVAIGASTGGVEALQELLAALPATAPGVLVTQHMPAGFTAAFARRMDARCAMTVTEATDGARVMPGHVFIANGDRHLQLARSGARLVCRLTDGPPVSGHRPSVDVLFQSVAAAAGGAAVGVILTGMGRDGADGLLAMRNAGARTLGQDEASCLIYGMPKAAMQAGAVERELPLSRMAQAILA